MNNTPSEKKPSGCGRGVVLIIIALLFFLFGSAYLNMDIWIGLLCILFGIFLVGLAIELRNQAGF